MHNKPTHLDSKQYLRIALEMICKHGLSPNPVNYHVWYEYAVGRNETLNTAIDYHVGNGEPLSEGVIHQLFCQHIAGSEPNITSQARMQLKIVLAEIISAIQSADDQFSGSRENLNAIHDSIGISLSEADLEAIIRNIKREISDLKSTNDAFREQVQQASQKMSELNQKLARYHEQAHKDALTGLDNRRAFDKKLIEAVAESKQSTTTVCLIIADIDHFKKINDNHGHLVGDNVLRMVASTINESVKGRDTVARFGGEEFAILLTDTPMEGAMKLANDIRLAFERIDLKKRDTRESIGQITLSFGVARYRTGEDLNDFMKRADEALYQSKKTGRNKVTAHDHDQA